MSQGELRSDKTAVDDNAKVTTSEAAVEGERRANLERTARSCRRVETDWG